MFGVKPSSLYSTRVPFVYRTKSSAVFSSVSLIKWMIMEWVLVTGRSPIRVSKRGGAFAKRPVV